MMLLEVTKVENNPERSGQARQGSEAQPRSRMRPTIDRFVVSCEEVQ